MQLTTHFSLSEFASHDGAPFPPNVITNLQERDTYAKAWACLFCLCALVERGKQAGCVPRRFFWLVQKEHRTQLSDL